MRLLASLNVADATRPGFRRVAGIAADGETLVVAALGPGERKAETELSISLGEARALALDCLSGDRRALTRPGVARILSATAAMLFGVSFAAGALQEAGGNGGDADDAGHFRNQPAADGDEHPD